VSKTSADGDPNGSLPESTVFSKQQVVQALRSGSRLPARFARIITDRDPRFVSYRDVLDLYLAFSGMKDWAWSGPDGAVLKGSGALASTKALVRDALQWPVEYLRLRHLLKTISDDTPFTKPSPLPREILFLRSDHWFNVTSGGSVTHLCGVIEGFKHAGFRPLIVSSDLLAGVSAEKDFFLLPPDYSICRNVPNMPELLYNRQLLSQVPERVRETVSFIYQRKSFGNFAGALLKARLGVPYVCEFNGSDVWMSRQWANHRPLHAALLEEIEVKSLQAADLIVVVSDALGETLLSRGIDKEKILVNANGVDPDRYSPSVSGARVRSRLGFENKTVIGFIGTFGMWHGVELLAEAFATLLERNPSLKDSCRLLLIGDGPAREATERLLDVHGVRDCAVLTGAIPQEEGPEYLASCDLFASPHVPNPDGTPFFGSPTKLFEYMSMGKGIVAADLEQIGQVLTHGQSGWLVKPNDRDALVIGLQILVADSVLRERLGGQARKLVLQYHTWDQHTLKIIDALSKRMNIDMRNFASSSCVNDDRSVGVRRREE
jgi:glycosyltransferase involved in cell wall biosynthesis